MKTVWIDDGDEWYPMGSFYEREMPGFKSVEIPDKQLARWKKVMDEFEAMQVELNNLIRIRKIKDCPTEGAK